MDLWRQVGSRPIRPLSSLVLPAEQISAVVSDAEQFQASEAWYGACKSYILGVMVRCLQTLDPRRHGTVRASPKPSEAWYGACKL